MKYIITENQFIDVVLNENNGGRKLFNFAKVNGLDAAIKMVGSLKTYIDITHKGNLHSFFWNEDVKPYYIAGGTNNLFIHRLIINTLNLPEVREHKVLGNFKYGFKDGLPLNIEARLVNLYRNDNYMRVVGVGGDYEFGGADTWKKELPPKYKKHVLNQIIKKYNLDNYLP